MQDWLTESRQGRIAALQTGLQATTQCSTVFQNGGMDAIQHGLPDCSKRRDAALHDGVHVGTQCSTGYLTAIRDAMQQLLPKRRKDTMQPSMPDSRAGCDAALPP